MPNTVSPKGFRSRNFTLKQFDRLPRYAKEFLWELPFPATFGAAPAPWAMDSVRERTYAKFALDTERAYGPDHPQSATALARRSLPGEALDSTELGF